jgi:iron complex outermembrane receptor protein
MQGPFRSRDSTKNQYLSKLRHVKIIGVKSMKIRYQLAASAVALSICSFSSAAFAQSTGSIEVDDTEEAIVVTGTRADQGVKGVLVPDATKPRAVLSQELIASQASGQSILNTINQVPGVNFTNADAYGSSGGQLRIRGFDGNRISLTFDGFPLNDTGNYAIYSNQQLDPELISSVNVNLGTTDVDSPTASAAGGTVNYLTRTPNSDFGGIAAMTIGGENFRRAFGMLDTGELTSIGTRAFIAASKTIYDKFKGPGEINKSQLNAGVYQPIGDNGDFIYIKGHYNKNRNNFYRNISLTEIRALTGRSTMADVGGFSAAEQDAIFNFDNLASCNRTIAGAGAQNDGSNTGPNGSGSAAPSIAGSGGNNPLNSSSCSNFFGVRINPSNTGNIRVNSKFTMTDNLTLTFDAGYQTVKANGGGSTTMAENNLIVRGSSSLAGVDYNGDGDFLDTIRFYTPNNTQTKRFTILSSLIWDISDAHRVRVAYTFDRGRHRQTGEWGYLTAEGSAESPFGGLSGRKVLSADGVALRQRDRLSIALLNQFSAQYVGKFFDDALRVEAGLRMPFFERDLENFCFTQTGGSGFATCTSQPVGTTPVASSVGIFVVSPTAVGPYASNAVWAPFKANYNFSPILPSVGFTYRVTDDAAVFGSYAKGFSSPRTDNLYRAPIVNVDPETTDTFDLGVRYTTGRVQALATAWMTNFKNRIVTSFDQINGISVDRNIGTVKGKGVDVGIAIRPLDWFTFQGNASYNDSTLRDDILVSSTVTLPTKGKRVVETPKWTLGYRASVEFGPASAGLQVKYVSDRFATDMNDIKSGDYTTADFDARFDLETVGLKNSWLQLNVTNIFDRFYLANLGTQIAGPANNGLVTISGLAAGASIPGGSAPNFSIGAPRTVSGTIRIGF